MGGIVGFTHLEKASLDNWRDFTSSGDARKVAATCGVRYDGAKLISTAKLKMELILSLRHVTSAAGSFNMSWDA
eukprot:5209458-Karenia_brevis.AAC.1